MPQQFSFIIEVDNFSGEIDRLATVADSVNWIGDSIVECQFIRFGNNYTAAVIEAFRDVKNATCEIKKTSSLSECWDDGHFANPNNFPALANRDEGPLAIPDILGSIVSENRFRITLPETNADGVKDSAPPEPVPPMSIASPSAGFCRCVECTGKATALLSFGEYPQKSSMLACDECAKKIYDKLPPSLRDSFTIWPWLDLDPWKRSEVND